MVTAGFVKGRGEVKEGSELFLSGMDSARSDISALTGIIQAHHKNWKQQR